MDEDIKHIEDYLLGSLTEDETAAFHSRLESDEAFKAAFEFERQLFESFNEDSWSFIDRNHPEIKAYQSSLDTPEFSALKETLNQVTKEHNQESSTPKTKRKLFYYIAAASIAILIAIQFVFNQSTSGTELYYANIDMENLPSFVTRADEPETEAIKAQRLFENENYEESIALFQQLLDSKQNDARLYIYLGIALTETEQYENAKQVFEELINTDLIDAEKGYWYKALVYLKMGEKEKATQILQNIKAGKLYNFQKAETLINELE